jgi:hypothetical protein
MAAPTLSTTFIAYGLGTTRAFGSVTVATGDVCIVSSRISDTQCMPLTFTKTAGTSTIGTITRAQTLNLANSGGQTLDSFTVTAGGTLTISGTLSGANTTIYQWDAALVVATGSAGLGTSATQADGSTLVKSLTASAHSAVYASQCDWNAVATNTTAWTPAGSTEDIAQTDGVTHQASAGTRFSSLLAHWPDVAGGAVSYGTTAPTSTHIDIIVWEIKGGVDPPPGHVSVVSQAVIRASYI